MKSEKRAGILLSYILIVAEAISGLLYTVILLGNLGQSEYGLYKLALSWMSIISVLDFGLGSTITRYVIKYKTEKDRDGERNFLGMAFAVYGILAFVVLLVGIGMAAVLPAFSKSIDPGQAAKFRAVFMILVAKTCVILFNHAYSGRFVAYERFVLIKSVAILNIVLRILLVAALLPLMPSAVTVVSVDFLLTLAQLICYMVASRAYKMERVRLGRWDKSLFAEVFVFTSSVFVASVINQFNGNVDNIVLGIFATTAAVGLYSSAMQIYTVYCSLSTAIQEVFLPQVSKSVFEKRSDREVTMSIIKPSRMQMIVLLLALTGFILFGYEFFELWIGDSYSAEMLRQAYTVGCIVMTSATWQLFQNSATNILKAKNLLRGKILITGASTVANFLVTVALVPRFGMIGAAIGTAFSMIFGYGIATNIYYSTVVKLDLRLYYTKTFSKIWYAVPLAFAAGIGIRFISLDGLVGFIVKICLYMLVYIVSVGLLGMNKEERKFFSKITDRVIRRK
ncbi:MAG: polysaccharide biosynthesis protein [Clostridia bacterium]|nr:polysaccharide biosynthesis protein [Clostridia bacterium]